MHVAAGALTSGPAAAGNGEFRQRAWRRDNLGESATRLAEDSRYDKNVQLPGSQIDRIFDALCNEQQFTSLIRCTSVWRLIMRPDLSQHEATVFTANRQDTRLSEVAARPKNLQIETTHVTPEELRSAVERDGDLEADHHRARIDGELEWMIPDACKHDQRREGRRETPLEMVTFRPRAAGRAAVLQKLQ